MAIITTCTVLGTLHTKQLLHLLEDDIEEERDKHRFDDDDKSISSNEARLQHSQDIVLSKNIYLISVTANPDNSFFKDFVYLTTAAFGFSTTWLYSFLK